MLKLRVKPHRFNLQARLSWTETSSGQSRGFNVFFCKRSCSGDHDSPASTGRELNKMDLKSSDSWPINPQVGQGCGGQRAETAKKRRREMRKQRSEWKMTKRDRCIRNKNIKGLFPTAVGQDKHGPRQRAVTQGCVLFGPLSPSSPCSSWPQSSLLDCHHSPVCNPPPHTHTKEIVSGMSCKSKTRQRNPSDDICCVKMDLAMEAKLS